MAALLLLRHQLSQATHLSKCFHVLAQNRIDPVCKIYESRGLCGYTLRGLHILAQIRNDPSRKIHESAGLYGYRLRNLHMLTGIRTDPSSKIHESVGLCGYPVNSLHVLARPRTNPSFRILESGSLGGCFRHFSRSSRSSKPISRAYRKRRSKRLKAMNKPVLDELKFQGLIKQLPPRFTNEDLCDVLASEDDPLVCLELFNWASQQPRFRHDVGTYHVVIKRLGVAKMYEEMDSIIRQVISVPCIGNEALFNTTIYFYTEARKLTRAVNIFKYMRNSRNIECRPSIRTYNILFTAMLSRGNNSFINYMYMETIRCLFKQMVNDGIDPDIYSLNAMVKGYVLSNHINDALRIFHQMGVVYNCSPNSFTYNYLVHGLCAQGRTNNAKELYDEMKEQGFVLSSKSYNSLVSALAINGEIDEAVSCLWEMVENYRSIDFITFRTVLDELCRRRRSEEAMRLLEEWRERRLVDRYTHEKLLSVFDDGFGNLNNQFQFSVS